MKTFAFFSYWLILIKYYNVAEYLPSFVFYISLKKYSVFWLTFCVKFISCLEIISGFCYANLLLAFSSCLCIWRSDPPEFPKMIDPWVHPTCGKVSFTKQGCLYGLNISNKVSRPIYPMSQSCELFTWSISTRLENLMSLSNIRLEQ